MGPNRLSDVPTVIGDGVLSQRETDGGTARTLSRYLPRPFSGLRCGSVHNSWRVMWRMSMVEVVIFIALVVRENAALRLRPRLPHSLSRVGPVQHFSERVHWRRRPEAHQAPRSAAVGQPLLDREGLAQSLLNQSGRPLSRRHRRRLVPNSSGRNQPSLISR
jgi:hypothetical protein